MRINRKVAGFLILSFVINITKLLAFDNDSTKTKTLHPPKHYFSNSFYFDLYSPNKRTLDTVNTISKQLKSYKMSQLNMGFNIPCITKDFYNHDSTRIQNIHFLLTGGMTALNMNFEGIKTHTFIKTYMGVRGIYNNGKKSIFFAEMAPFNAFDLGYRKTGKLRMSATVLYNCSVNQYFAFRVGYSRSFLFGNLSNLPYLGIRVGRLDKVNFSLQFPRSITFNIPIGNYVRTSLYAKPQGGFYTFANSDTIHLGNALSDDYKKLNFGRSEFLLGTRIDIMPSRHFEFYLSGGFTTQNNIEFFPTTGKPDMIYGYNNYYKQHIKNGVFLNFGMMFRFGKTKSIYNSQQMYNAIDMNNSNNSGDINLNHSNGEIPKANRKMGKNKTDDVVDLIETQDLY